MKITYLGHSCFLLETASGTRIVTDPYGDIGYPLPPVSADIVTVSHGHYDHCNVAAVGGSPVVLASAGEFSAGDVKIRAAACFHDDAHGAKRGANLAFRFEADGIAVCHLGDIGEPCKRALIEALSPIDVLLVPVGGHYTVDAPRAKEYVEAFSAAYTVPMHYYTPGLQVDIAGVQPFLGLFGGEKIVRCGDTFIPEKSAFPHKKIIVMERKKA